MCEVRTWYFTGAGDRFVVAALTSARGATHGAAGGRLSLDATCGAIRRTCCGRGPAPGAAQRRMEPETFANTSSDALATWSMADFNSLASINREGVSIRTNKSPSLSRPIFA